MASEHGNDGVDLAAVWDEHMRCEFVLRDAESTLQTMGDDPCLVEVPVGTGAKGREAVLAFYRDHFIPSWPDDASVAPLSRTVDADRVVDEFVVSFTHSKPMDWWLPGVEPTGKSVVLPHVVIVGFEDGKIAYEHVYWDQASLLVQIGALDPALVPALGRAQASAVADNAPSNDFIERHHRG
jgi:carboxymethylenebutenolidase